MISLSFEQLDQVRQDTNTLVPGYFINELDPTQALDNGVGNCYAKAMVAAGIIVLRHNIEPVTSYSSRLHATDRPNIGKPVDFKTKKNMAHIALLVPVTGGGGVERVMGLSFGSQVYSGKQYRQEDVGEIIDYNEYANVSEQLGIIPTQEGDDSELTMKNWRIGGLEYIQKLDRQPPDIDNLITRIQDRLDTITRQLIT